MGLIDLSSDLFSSIVKSRTCPSQSTFLYFFSRATTALMWFLGVFEKQPFCERADLKHHACDRAQDCIRFGPNAGQ